MKFSEVPGPSQESESKVEIAKIDAIFKILKGRNWYFIVVLVAFI